jgi:hypothetical protein
VQVNLSVADESSAISIEYLDPNTKGIKKWLIIDPLPTCCSDYLNIT